MHKQTKDKDKKKIFFVVKFMQLSCKFKSRYITLKHKISMNTKMYGYQKFQNEILQNLTLKQC